MLVEIDTVVELYLTNQFKSARLGNPKAAAHIAVDLLPVLHGHCKALIANYTENRFRCSIYIISWSSVMNHMHFVNWW